MIDIYSDNDGSEMTTKNKCLQASCYVRLFVVGVLVITQTSELQTSRTLAVIYQSERLVLSACISVSNRSSIVAMVNLRSECNVDPWSMTDTIVNYRHYKEDRRQCHCGQLP